MKTELDKAMELLNKAQSSIMNVANEVDASKEVFKLSELNDYINRYCAKTNTTKADIALLADIGKSTLTAALKNPEKATMTTINAIGSVVGFEVLIGRQND